MSMIEKYLKKKYISRNNAENDWWSEINVMDNNGISKNDKFVKQYTKFKAKKWAHET